MFCKNCGRELKGTEKFCPDCGGLVIQDQGIRYSKNIKKRIKIAFLFLVILAVTAITLGVWLKKRGMENTGISYGAVCMRTYNEDGLMYFEEKKFNTQGRAESYAKILADGTIESEILYKYDDAGNLIESKENERGIRWTRKLEYDSKGLLVKQSDYNSEGKIDLKYELEYDRKGRQTGIKRYNFEGTLTQCTEIEYDKSGNLIGRKYYDSEGKLEWSQEYIYDKNNNMIRYKYHNEKENFEEISTYEYDESGNWIKGSIYSEGSLSRWRELEYDENGNRVKETLYNSDDSVMHWVEYEYIAKEDKEKLAGEDISLLLQQASALGCAAKFLDEGANVQVILPNLYIALQNVLPLREAQVIDTDPRNYISEIEFPSPYSQIYGIPVEDLKWLCEEVLQMDYQPVEESQDIENYRRFQYVENHMFYYFADEASDWEGVVGDKLLDYRYLKDGSIYAEINLVDVWHGDETFSIYVRGNIISTNMRKYWTFYDLSLQPIDSINDLLNEFEKNEGRYA